jgi:O-antigen/teichoic acid export membrane protein
MSRKTSTVRNIAANSLWYAVETGLSVVAALVSSIILARVIGPTKMGYYSYVTWLMGMTTLLGSVGLPLTARKFMGECLAREQLGQARAVFFRSVYLQARSALLLTIGGMILAWFYGDAGYRAMTLLLAASVFPRMVALLPTQANMALENSRANVPGALANAVLTLLVAFGCMKHGWGLNAVAAGVLIAYIAELTLKSIPVARWAQKMPEAPLDATLRSRMTGFSRKGTVLMLLQVVVWGRSDIFFLRLLQHDIRQITFFSLAFTLSERLLLFSQTLSHGLGVNQFAQFARDPQRQYRMLAASARYMLLLSVPPLLGTAALAGPLVAVLYGKQYLPAIPVFALACAFGLPKAIMPAVLNLLRITERQDFLIVWGIVSGLAGVAIDVALVPAHGAVGAAIANGVSQTVAILGYWAYAIRKFNIRMPYRSIGKIVGAGVAMALVAWLSCQIHPAPVAIAVGVLAGGVVFLGALRLSGVLEREDRERLRQLESALPRPVRRWVDAALDP